MNLKRTGFNPERGNRMEYKKAHVVSVNEIAPSIYDMLLKAPAISAQAKPGQFICLYSNDSAHLLPRPISICEVFGEHVRLVFRIAGYGTRELSAKKTGDEVTVLGPIGNGYPEIPKDKTVTVVGGGIGIPPMLYLARKLYENGNELNIVLGYRDAGLFLKDAFSGYGKVYVATDDGSVGFHGNVVGLIEAEKLPVETVCACGPMPMLKGLSAYTEANGGTAFISLEERMACGIGACLGCITKTKETDGHSHVRNARICTEGPVFDSKVLDFTGGKR